MSDIWKNEPIKCTLTFDKLDTNGVPMEYVAYLGVDSIPNIDSSGAYVPTPDSNFITGLSLSEDESETSGNPLGILTSNSISISIFDAYNRLMPSNEDSPYYGYMRNGTKVELEIAYDGIKYEPYGTFYVNDWTTGWANGSNDVAIISASDRLEFIYNIGVPKLGVYSGISISTLLINLFIGLEKIGVEGNSGDIIYGNSIPNVSVGNLGDYYVNEEEIGIYRKESSSWRLLYYIDKRLNLSLTFGITVGSKVGEVLNSIAQALIARVVLDRADVLRLVPALEVYGDTYILDDDVFENGKSLHNSSNIYNKAKVNYAQLGDSKVDTLIENYGFTLKLGENRFNGLRFKGKSLTVEEIYFDTPDTVGDVEVVLDNLRYQAYQDGIDVTVTNNSGVEVKCDLIINGRLINSIEASEETDILGSDTKVANEFILDTTMLQNSDDAKKLANDISLYLEKMNKLVTISTLLTPRASTGDKVIVSTSNKEFNGNYKIISNSTEHGVGYTKSVTLVKIDNVIEDKLVWYDSKIWTDSGIWKE